MEPVPVIDARFQERFQKYKADFINKQSVSLKKHFKAILIQKPKIIGTDDCRRILKMLHPDFKGMNDMELSRFGQVLRYYVKAWPRWGELTLNFSKISRLDEEKLTDEWYIEFSLYVSLKMADALEISKGLKNDKCGRLVHQGTQTRTYCVPNKTDSNYYLELAGPPSLVYSALFNITEGEVVARQHLTTPFSVNNYQNAYKSRFINLPYVSVQGTFADISFERKNVHEIERFITMGPVSLKKTYSKDVTVVCINEEQEVKVFNLYLYKMYFRQFMEILRNEPTISDTRKKEFKLIIEEILKDIEEAFVCSSNMPTNVTVTFTIGDNIYIRNKQTASRDINFYEIITPKVALSLYHFDAKQDLNDTSRITFESLNFFEKSREHFIEHMNSCRLMFECLLCSQQFLSLFTIKAHFEQEHKEEHLVTCGSCKEQIDVATLVGKRWRHRCRGSQEV